eukprot:GSChrysophyteH1.ASY1.ANO1.403.1 assembled CDS
MDVALNSSVWVSSPEFAGWLQKRGFHWRKLWKTRWVALHGAEVVYMDKEPTLENSSSMVMTKAQITSSTIIEPDDIDGHELGFKININNGKSPTWCLRAESQLEKKNWLTRLNHVIAIVRWLEEYEKVRVLGVGGTGVVYELLHKRNGRKFAMKEMEIKNKAQMRMAIQEAEMLKDIMENISHPNIIHIEKVFQVGSKFYLVFPLCTGGELYEHIIRRGYFTEYDAALLTRDLVGGIHALHAEDILHLDIKPENILFESLDADAKIKITDFGLSRMFDGDLDTERLRGTIGYMSPELILCGHCSKATDVFAAGVVLYILLCGRPPFQSKSNREVLERTCRGTYSMDGPQWDDVSDDAKDLVRGMLILDPSKRMTAAEVLEHKWLSNLDDNSTNSTSAAVVASGNKHKSRGTGVSLGSLSVLSGHVQARRSEKLASSFTRLVSSLQSKLTDGSPLPDLACKDEDMMVLQNPDIRQALTAVFDKVCTDGKMPLEHFICVLRHFGMGPGPAAGPVSNLPGLFLCRFIDRDGDGFISADDLFTTQALIMMKSELFLRAVFRMYTEALWYPGRQLNLASYARSPRKGPSPQSGRSAVMDRPEDKNSNDVVEPPKFITARHVGEVFAKIGYKPDTGKKIFSVLCFALKRRRQMMNRGDSSSSLSGEAEALRGISLSKDKLSSINSDSDKDSNSLNLSLDNPDDSFEGAHKLPLAPGNLMKEFSKDEQDDRDKNSSVNSDKNGTEDSSKDLDEHEEDIEEELSKIASNASSVKMDVNDFMDACQVDDVLIQAVLRKPRQRFLELLSKVQVTQINNRDLTSANKIGESVLNTGSGVADVLNNGIDTSALEEQLVEALVLAERESRHSFPLAAAVLNSSKNALLDVAAGLTSSASNLMSNFAETILDTDNAEQPTKEERK